MEANMRWVALTAVAPVAWGTTYFVTHEFLPADHPLYGAALRALPAGLVLLALRRQRPHGAWWWRSAVLGLLNMSVFFVLVYTASQLLPTSVASTVMAVSPLTMVLIAWPLVSERPRPAHLAGAAIGLGGVCLMLFTGVDGVSVPGVLASAAAMLMSSFGYILAKRWSAGADVLASTAWQLTAGGLFLLPVAVAVEGPPPALPTPTLLAFCYVTLVATALAFTAWFTGLRHLPAGTVGLIGLLNPVTGVLLGIAFAGESLTVQQLCGLLLVLAGVALGQPRRTSRRDGGQAHPHPASDERPTQAPAIPRPSAADGCEAAGPTKPPRSATH
ncbi:EamA family transporter [Streptomyces samsunensis]|uniref:DMT family transporter n=1 Tax=Streptomyces malaysiensis TaxID=92644 RepID=UPI0015830107|nr:EamA family transporter [Streptomyces samsunensis]MCC4314784.1 DMT family transporter [Streptomyces malaysiensis]NUH39299.1 EamA family transporter [Streptomyces samsunensis]